MTDDSVDKKDVPHTAPHTVPPRNRRAAALVGLRIAAGAVGIGVAVVAIAAAGLAPIPSFQSVPPRTVVTPVPAPQELVCPGAILRLGDELGQDATTPRAIGSPLIDFGSPSAVVDSSAVTQSDAGTGGTSAAPYQLSIPPAVSSDEVSESSPAGEAVLLSGSQSQVPSGAEFTGLAAARCQGAASETWLVGGSTDVGRTTLVTLANPSDVASSVALEIFSEDGRIVSAGATGIVVQPHGQRVLSLAGFAPAIASPVVRVTSRGGQIAANLQQVTVRGLDAGGVEIIGASERPASSQVIPGVVVDRSLAVSESRGAQGFEDFATVLRLLVPGEKSSTVTVTIAPDGVGFVDDEEPQADANVEVGSGGQSQVGGTSFSVELPAGRVTDIPIEGLADGVYTVKVSSVEPVIAGARVSTVSDGANAGAVSGTATRRPESSDFAWFSSASVLEGSSIATIATGPQPRLHLHNPDTADATVTVRNLDGSALSVIVPARASTSVAVTPRSTIVVSGLVALYASVSFTGDAQLASYAVSSPAADSAPINVFVK
jgi:hypothetical protein